LRKTPGKSDSRGKGELCPDTLVGGDCATIEKSEECSSDGRQEESMGELLTPTHLIIVLVVALLLFGPRKLPELGKGLGEGLRGFKDGIKGSPDAAKQDTPAPKPEVSTEVK
jgi:sec-independent protein translocase protein TatA